MSTLSTDTPSAIPPFIPAQMLNEFTYCLRPSYLEWVRGEWDDDRETDEGDYGERAAGLQR
jgi:CRISPR-associated protein Cas1